ncbi:MAG: hypothetical protein M3067_14495 [Chloroflexota bacterium]|nr:hypothetical protein [Chloroflexota bacterium]
MTHFDVETLRRRFPALALTHDGRPMAFFDGPGGTQVPDSVIDGLVESLARIAAPDPASRTPATA